MLAGRPFTALAGELGQLLARFERVACAMGGTGHHGCDRFYIRAL